MLIIVILANHNSKNSELLFDIHISIFEINTNQEEDWSMRKNKLNTIYKRCFL